jgi:hypothetical protein
MSTVAINDSGEFEAYCRRCTSDQSMPLCIFCHESTPSKAPPFPAQVIKDVAASADLSAGDIDEEFRAMIPRLRNLTIEDIQRCQFRTCALGGKKNTRCTLTTLASRCNDSLKYEARKQKKAEDAQRRQQARNPAINASATNAPSVKAGGMSLRDRLRLAGRCCIQGCDVVFSPEYLKKYRNSLPLCMFCTTDVLFESEQGNTSRLTMAWCLRREKSECNAYVVASTV